MKRCLLLIVAILSVGFGLYAHTSGQEQLVRITGVSCDLEVKEWDQLVYVERVSVELTSAGVRYMKAYGYDEISVLIGPKNHFWDFIKDSRKSKNVYLTLDKQRSSTTFKCSRSCRGGEFEVKDINWFKHM